MTCESPLTITNRKLAYHSGYDRPKMVVPCSVCESCRENIKNSWIIRTYFHWKKFYESKGKVLFVTLTYRSRCLPFVHDGDFKFACFSHKDVNRWINSIRKFFEVHYNLVGIDYLVTCEYGKSKKGTHRPHYHALLFFPPSDNLPSVPMLKKVVEYYWFGSERKFDAKKKKYYYTSPLGKKVYGKKVRRMGFVYWSKRYGAEVTCSKAAHYVGKYICKDLEFYEKEDIKKYLSIDGNKEKVKDKLPRHWQSKSFGLSMLDYILSKPYTEQLDCLELGVSFETESFRYTCPLYIQNKLKYEPKCRITEVNGEKFVQRVMSERGLKYELDLLKRRFESEEYNLRVALSPIGLYKYLPDCTTLVRWCHSNHIFGVSNFAELSNYLVDTFVHPYSFKDVVAYKLAYRGFAYEYQVLGDIKPTPEYLTSVAYDVMADRLNFNYTHYDFDLNDKSKRELDNERLMINYISGYQGFETLLFLLDSLRSMSAERRMIVVRRDEEILDSINSKLIDYDEE